MVKYKKLILYALSTLTLVSYADLQTDDDDASPDDYEMHHTLTGE